MNLEIITEKTTKEIIAENPEQMIELVKKAYLAYEKGDAVNPDSCFLRFPHRPKSRIIALPAYIGGDVQMSGIKWIASNPLNVDKGIPRASAVMILNDEETGYPLACLAATQISAARTAASAVLGANYLSNQEKKCRHLGIVGTSVIAAHTYFFLKSAGWTIDNVNLFDLNIERAQGFAENTIDASLHGQVTVIEEIDNLLAASDLIIMTTSALEPHIQDASLFDKNAIILHISLRDLAPEVVVQCNNIVDGVDHVLQANTSLHLAEQKFNRRDFIQGTIGGLIRGEFDLDDDKPTIFSPMGMGILDLALASFIYREAKRGNQTIIVDNFIDVAIS